MAVSFIGELLHKFLPLPVPAGIYGIILLFILLESKLLPLSSIKEVGTFFIDIMPVMLVPAAVELMDYWGLIRSQLIKYIIATVVSTIVVMAVSGLITQCIIRRKK